MQVDLPGHDALYRGPAVLIRPDQHIAWRGVPGDGIETARVLAHCVGRGSATALPGKTATASAAA